MFYAALTLLLLASNVWAQIEFRANASASSIAAGQTFEVTFTIIGAATGVPTPQPKEFSNLDLVGGPSTSTQTSIVNGRVSSEKSFTYYFRAKSPGKAVIGAVQANIKGRIYTTAPIEIQVTPAGERARGSQREEVFIQVVPDKREAFVGEEIVLTYKLYFATSVYAPEFKELPKTPGFWMEEFDMPSQLVPRDEVVDGQSYKSVVIRKVALFGTTSGELTVDPLTAVVQVERRQGSRGRTNDPFNDPFFSFGRRRESVEVSCRSLTLRIKPLPDDGKPVGDIAVGRYSVSARLDKNQCETNDAVTLSILVRGTGNIKTLPIPKVRIPTDFEVFDPKTVDQIKRGPDHISGSKTYEYVIIPRAAGSQIIPPVSLTFFDPETRRYEEVSSPELRLEVQRGTNRVSDNSLPVASKREVQSIGQDIAYVKNSIGTLTIADRLPHNTSGFWIGLASPWVLLAGVVFAVRRRVRFGQTSGARRQKLLKSLRTKLTTAEEAMVGRKQVDATRIVSDAVTAIAREWTGIKSPTATIEEFALAWHEHGLPDSLWVALVNAKETCERMRFAGGTTVSAELGSAIGELKKVCMELEGNGK